MDMELLTFLLGIFLGTIFGFRAAQRFYITAFRKLLEVLNVSNQDLIRAVKKTAGPELLIQIQEIEEAQREQPREHAQIEIRVEKVQDQLYAYRVDNDVFIGQGATPDDLIARIAERYKNTKFTVPKDHGAEFMKTG
jgi:hypothetical protein